MSLATITRTLASLALLLTISGLYRVDVRGWWRQTEMARVSEARSIQAEAQDIETQPDDHKPLLATADQPIRLAALSPRSTSPQWLRPGARGARAP